MRKWVARRRAEWFADKVCIDCGTDQDLQLDHVNPKLKVHHAIWSWSQKRRDVELAKCVPRCRSCHRAKSNGEMAKGEQSGTSKLTVEKVLDIRRRVAAGEKYRDVAKVHDVHYSLVGYIARRDIWKHI